MNGIGNLGGSAQSGGGAMSKLQATMEQVSSGKKLNSASDNAAGIAVAVSMVSDLGGLRQANRNVGDAMAMLDTAEGGMGQISDSLIRMRELSVQAGNSTLSASQRGMIQAEMDNIAESIDRVSATTEFNGTSLLDGSTPTLNFQVGANASAADQMTVALEDTSTAALGVDALSVASAASAGVGIDAIDGAMDQLNTFRARVGAATNQLSEMGDNLRNSIVAASESVSQVRDTDFGEASAAMAGQSVLMQAQIAMQVQGNMNQQSVLKLLG